MNDPEQNVRALKRCCVRFKVPDFIDTKLYSRKVCKTEVDLELFKDNVKIVEDQCRRLVGGRRNYALNHPCCHLECDLPNTLFTENDGEIGLDESVLLEHIHGETEKAMKSHRKLPGNKCVRTASKRPLEFHRQHPDQIAEPQRPPHDAIPSRNDASQKDPVADCSSMPAPSLRQGPDKFQQTMNELKNLLGACAHCDLLAVLEDEHKAIARELEDLKKMQSVTEGLQSAPKNTGTRTLDAQSILPQLQDPHSGEEVRTEPSGNLTIAGFLGGTCADEIPPAPLPKPSASNGPEDDSWNNRRSCQPRSSDFGAMEDSVPAEGCLNSQSPKVLAEVPECYPSPNTLMQTEDQFQDGPSSEGLDSGAVSQESSAGGCQAWNKSTLTLIQADDPFQDIPGFEDPTMHPQDDQLSAPWENYFCTWLI